MENKIVSGLKILADQINKNEVYNYFIDNINGFDSWLWAV